MIPQFVRFLATVPLPAARNSFDNLVIQAIDATETPVSEWDFREGTFGAPEVAAIAAQHIHEDSAYIVEAEWDLWTFESETLKWKQEPNPLEIVCRGLLYGDAIGVPLASGLADWGAPGILIYAVMAVYAVALWRMW